MRRAPNWLFVLLAWVTIPVALAGAIVPPGFLREDPGQCIELCGDFFLVPAIRVFSVVFFGSALANALTATIRAQAISRTGLPSALTIASVVTILLGAGWSIAVILGRGEVLGLGAAAIILASIAVFAISFTGRSADPSPRSGSALP